MSARVKWVRGRVGWLGVIPAECWDMPGFKECNDQNFETARTACQNQGGTQAEIDACIRSYQQQLTEQICVPNLCATGTRAAAYPWRAYSDETCAAQDEINAELPKYGYAPIARDCRLGPATCGAANQINKDAGRVVVGIPDTCFQHQGEWVSPTKRGAPVAPPTQVAAAGGGGGVVAVVLLAVAAAAAIAFGQGG